MLPCCRVAPVLPLGHLAEFRKHSGETYKKLTNKIQLEKPSHYIL